MASYRITDVGIVDQYSDTRYLIRGTGTANGEDANNTTEFYCKCTERPKPTSEDSKLIYTITGTNPSQLHVTFTMKCIRSPLPFTAGSTICTFKKA